MAQTPATLQQQLCELDRNKHTLLNTIASYKRPGNILLALVLAYFSPFTLRQKARKVRDIWREIEYTATRMRALQEQQVALLFIECLQEELDKLPDTIFLTRILQEEHLAQFFIECLQEELDKLPYTIFITNPEPQHIE